MSLDENISGELGHLYVISGPSGVGKGTIINELLKDSSLNLTLSVSCTTRKPRPNEIEGVNYYFLTEDTFETLINEGNFLEYANVFGSYYGTPKDKVLEKLQNGVNVLLEIDVQGAMQVKKNYKDAILIFIMPPSEEELLNRLKGRATETPEQIERRILQAQSEMNYKDKYDFIVVNDKITDTVAEIKSILNNSNKGKDNK